MEGSDKFTQSYDHCKILCKLASGHALTCLRKISCEILFKDQSIFPFHVNLLIFVSFLLIMYRYCQEKIDVGHSCDLKG